MNRCDCWLQEAWRRAVMGAAICSIQSKQCRLDLALSRQGDCGGRDHHLLSHHVFRRYERTIPFAWPGIILQWETMLLFLFSTERGSEEASSSSYNRVFIFFPYILNYPKYAIKKYYVALKMIQLCMFWIVFDIMVIVEICFSNKY